MKRLLAFFGILALTGCGGESETRPAAPGAPAAPEAVEGAPSLDVDWGPEEISAFDVYLSKLAQRDYPKAAGALFAKFVGSAEQPVLRDPAVPLKNRANLSLVMFQAINNVLARYVAAHNSGIDYSEELSELHGMMLSAGRQLFGLIDEFLPTLDKEADDYAIRIDGLEKVKSGIGTILAGALLSLRETAIYSDGERLVIAKALAADGPDLLARLPKGAQDDFQAKLKGTLSEETVEEIRDALAGFGSK